MAYLSDLPHTSPNDRDRWSKLLCQTISSLCRNGMIGNEVIKIQGLIGITLCNKEVFLVDIADHFEVDDVDLQEDSQSGLKKTLSKSMSRKRKATNPKSMKSPDDYYLDNENRDGVEYGYSNESHENHKRSYPEMWNNNTNPNEICMPPVPSNEMNDSNNHHSYENQPTYDYHSEFMQIKSENLDSVDPSVLDDAILKETTTTPTRKMRAKKEFSQTVATTKHTAELLGYQDFTPASTRPYTCRLCDASFSKRFCLANHIVTVHQVGGKYVCKQCGRQFLQRNRYMLHIEKHSTDGTKLVCPDCGKVFTVRGNYENHLKKCGAAINIVPNNGDNDVNNLINNTNISNNNDNNNIINNNNNNEISADLVGAYGTGGNQFNATMSDANNMDIYHHHHPHHQQNNNNNNNNIVHNSNDDDDNNNDDDDDDNAGGADDDVIKENVLLYDSDLEG